jgi:hypothetical protein
VVVLCRLIPAEGPALAFPPPTLPTFRFPTPPAFALPATFLVGFFLPVLEDELPTISKFESESESITVVTGSW